METSQISSFRSIFLPFYGRPCPLTLSRASAKCRKWRLRGNESRTGGKRNKMKGGWRWAGKRGEEMKRNRAYQEKERKRSVRFAQWTGKLTRGLAPQYQDLTRCVSPPRWDLQPPKPPPLSEPLSSLLSSSSSSSKSRFLSPAPRLPLPIISASLPSQPPSLSCAATSRVQTQTGKCLMLAPVPPLTL